MLKSTKHEDKIARADYSLLDIMLVKEYCVVLSRVSLTVIFLS